MHKYQAVSREVYASEQNLNQGRDKANYTVSPS